MAHVFCGQFIPFQNPLMELSGFGWCSSVYCTCSEMRSHFLLKQMERFFSKWIKVFPEEEIFLMTVSVNVFTRYRLQRVLFPSCASLSHSRSHTINERQKMCAAGCWVTYCSNFLLFLRSSTGNDLKQSFRRAQPKETQHTLSNFQLSHTLTSTISHCLGVRQEGIYHSQKCRTRVARRPEKQIYFTAAAASLEDNVGRGRIWR